MAKPSRRNRQIVRTWEMLRSIEERPATLQQLAFDFSVSTRTVRRFLEALEEAGFPLYDETDERIDGARRWHLLTKGVVPARRAA